MANAKKDQNGRNSITCASNANGTDIVIVTANTNNNNGLSVDDASTGSDNGNNQGNAMIDENGVAVWFALASDGSGVLVPLYANKLTHRLLVDFAGGSGTVSSVSVVSANGFAGTVATATTTPAITLTTTITGILQGNGTAISAASTTGSGSVVLSGSPALTTPSIAAITVSGGILTLPTGATDTLVSKNSTDILTNKNLSSGTNTFPTFNQNTTGSAATLTTTRTIWGQNFNGSANVTGTLALGTSDLTLTGSIGATGARATKVWAAAVEVTTLAGLTIGGTQILTSLTAPQFTTIELGAASDTTLSRVSAGVIAVEGVTVPTISSTNTLTNKRVTKRTGTTTSSATPTINTDNVDFYSITAQTVDITSFTTNLSGTPTEGQTLWITITGTGARAITWGASFEASTVALPTTTVTTNRLDVGFVWNTVTSKWRCVASA